MMSAVQGRLGLGAATVLVVIVASWGLQQVAVKLANEGISPVTQAALRSVGALILLSAWAWLRRIPLRDKAAPLGWGLALGVFFAVDFALLFWGLDLTSASRGVVFYYTSPFMVAAVAHFIVPGERLTRRMTVGLMAAVAGTALALADRSSEAGPQALLGDLMCLGAAIAWAGTIIVIKATAFARTSATTALFYQLAGSVVLLPLAAWALGEPGVFDPTALVVGALAYQVVIVAFISYLIFFWMLQRYPAANMSAFTFLTPVFGVLAGYLLLDEPISLVFAAGCALIVLGIHLVNTGK